MITSMQARFLTLLLSGLSLIGMLFLMPQSAKADIIPATGQCVNPNTRTGFGCADPNYQQTIPCPSCNILWQKTDLSQTSPGFFAAPAGPSRAYWIAPLGDVQFPQDPVQSVRVSFTILAGTDLTNGITITGTLAALGFVSAAINGVGGVLDSGGIPLSTSPAPYSLVALNPFTISAPGVIGQNTLDFIFIGCSPAPVPCQPFSFAQVAALLVDPSWSPAALGTILSTTPEATLFADGGAPPPGGSTQVPEPGSLVQLGSGLVAIAGIARRKLLV